MTVPASNNTQVARTEPKPSVALGRIGNLDEMYRLATALSMSGLIPEALRNKPNDVLVTILYGQELSLSAVQAMQVIDVVKGKPFLRANLWVALARKAGHKVRVVEQTAEQCTIEVVRSDDPDGPMRVTYSMADAKTAGLTTNANYQKNPKAMLYARAASTAIRQACPEVALGFGDEAEAMVIGSEREDRVASLGRVAAERTPAAPTADSDVEDAEVVDEDAQRAELLAMAAEHETPATAGPAVEDPPNLFGDDADPSWPAVTPAGGKA